MGKGGCILSGNASGSIKAESNAKSNPREITPSLLATKTSVDECWIAYEGGVYDVTHWLAKHPGGIRSIMSASGSDASSVMKSLHTPSTLVTFMKRIRKVGVLVEEDSATISTEAGSEIDKKMRQKQLDALARSQAMHKDFDALGDKLLAEGWFDAQPLAYIFPIARCAAFLSAGMQMVMWTQGESAAENPLLKGIALLFGSMLLGFFLQNIAFMGHDAGHGSVTGKFRSDLWFGFFVGNAFAGIDVGWWKSTHYVHHSATNSLHDDPDIQHMPLLCFDERMGDSRWSTYHGRYMPLDAIGRAMLPYQHYYFYPVMAVARINLYIQSIIHLVKTCPFVGDRTIAGKKVVDEVSGEVKEKYAWPTPSGAVWIVSVLSLSFYWYMVYSFFSQLDVFTAAVSFTICHLTSGLLHVQILLSHVAMHYCADGHGTTEAVTAPNGNGEAGYYEWQALSTMDVDCSPWMDWFHGGLQFQLEHHLFPRVPRWHLRKLCVLTDEIFAKYDVPVVRVPFIEGNKMILRHMATVGANVAKMKTM
jgi:fatty acid desaturase/predicted heme/steroid binding protein